MGNLFGCERAVLLDTQAFDSLSLDFKNKNLLHLAGLASSGRVKLLLTEVIAEEVKAHITHHAEDVVSQLRSATNHPFFAEVDVELRKRCRSDDMLDAVKKAGLTSFKKFLKDSRADILTIASVDAGDVFKDYFSQKPPFGSGKKKNEFPDAFSLRALLLWAGDKKFPIDVISADADIEAFCKTNGKITCYKRLADFLSLFPDSKDVELIEDWLDSQWKNIEDMLGEEVADWDFDLDNADGEVNDVRLLSMDVMDRAVVEVEPTKARVTCEIQLEVEAVVYAYPPRRASFHDERDSCKRTGAAVDYLVVGVDIEVNYDRSNEKNPIELDSVQVVDRSWRLAIRIPDDWEPDRFDRYNPPD